MTTKIVRSFKFLSHVIDNLHLPALRSFRLPACSMPAPAWLINRGLETGQLKYIINTSLIVLFALLHTADGIVTYLGLKFDYVDEVNPVLIYFAGFLGLGFAISLLKMICLGIIGLLFYARRNIGNCWSTATLVSADAFYSWVVSNNILLVAAA